MLIAMVVSAVDLWSTTSEREYPAVTFHRSNCGLPPFHRMSNFFRQFVVPLLELSSVLFFAAPLVLLIPLGSVANWKLCLVNTLKAWTVLSACVIRSHGAATEWIYELYAK